MFITAGGSSLRWKAGKFRAAASPFTDRLRQNSYLRNRQHPNELADLGNRQPETFGFEKSADSGHYFRSDFDFDMIGMARFYITGSHVPHRIQQASSETSVDTGKSEHSPKLHKRS